MGKLIVATNAATKIGRKKSFDSLKADKFKAYALDENNYFTAGPNKGKLIPVKDDYFNESINKQLDKNTKITVLENKSTRFKSAKCFGNIIVQ